MMHVRFEKIYLSEDKTVTLDCCLYQATAELPARVKREAVIVCPGGGYSVCSEREADPIAMGYSAAGFHTFVLRYSLGEAAAWPNSLIDLCRAVKLVRERAEEWGVIPDKIAVCGFSAGGHLAASLGVHWTEEEIHTLSGCTAEQIKPNALILAYPVISTSWMENSGQLDRIIGKGDREKTYKDLNLHTCVSPSTPPSFVCHIFRDRSVPVTDSVKFAAALDQNNVPFELHIWPNGGHGMSLGTEETCAGWSDSSFAQWFSLSVDWLKRLFQNTEEANAPVLKAEYSSKL